MFGQATCPSAAVLNQLVLGLLSENELSAIGGHLETCRSCRTFIARSELSDPLVDALRLREQRVAADDSDAARIAAGVLQRTWTTIQAKNTPSDEPDLPPAEPLEAIEQLGPYRLVRLLGAGGMGVVFEAEDRRLHRPVALKLLRADWAHQPAAKQRFLDEARALAAVPHPHIVPIFDVGEEHGWVYLAMPLLNGETLEQRLEGGAKLPWSAVARIAVQVAEALSVAHQRGLIHRDLKPSNLWIADVAGLAKTRSDEFHIKLLDFGVALSVNAREDNSGAIVGTPAYMAPEQAQGNPELRSDLYALGGVLYRAITGRLPFEGLDPMGMLVAAATDPIPPVRSLAPACPKPLASLIEKLLEKSPLHRPPSAKAVIDTIHAWQRQRKVRRIAWVAGILLLVGMLLTGMGILAGPTIHRIATNQGELIVESDDSDVEIVVRKNGEEVVIRDGKTGKKYTLKAGNYDLQIVGDQPEYTLSATQVTLRRGETAIVNVRYKPWPTGELQAFDKFHGDIHSLAISSDGKFAIVGAGGPDNKGVPDPDCGAGAFLWETARAEEPQRLLGPEVQVRVVSLTPDGITALAADRLGGLWHWDLPTNREGRNIHREGSRIAAITWKADGQQFAVVRESGEVELRRRDGKLEKTIAVENVTALRSAAFLGDSGQLLIGDDKGTVRLLNLSTEKVVHEYSGHTEVVSSLATHPDGKRFLSTGADGAVYLWTLDGDKRSLVAQPDWKVKAGSAAFSADGQFAYFSLGRNVVCWDVREQRERYRFERHNGVVRGVCPLPDGRRVLSGGWDRRLRLWAIPTTKKNESGR